MLSDIPDHSTAVGVPARVVRRNGAKIVDLDQIHIPDPVAQELCRLEHQLDVLRRQVGRLEGRTQDSQKRGNHGGSAMKIYNTMTRQKEELVPWNPA